MEHQFKAKYQHSQMHQREMLMDSAHCLGRVKEIPEPSPPLYFLSPLSQNCFFPSSYVFSTASYQVFIGQTCNFLLKS